jgi:hypothetical protein
MEPLIITSNAFKNLKEASSPSSTSQVLIQFNNLKSSLTDFQEFNRYLFNPENNENPATLLRKLNALTDCNSPSYSEFTENVRF